MQSAYESDDQDFQPLKRPRTLCKLHARSATLEHQGPPKSFGCSSIGKENRPPVGVDTTTDCEVLPLRQTRRMPSSTSTKDVGLQHPPKCQIQTPMASRVPVRAFFTKSRGTHSCQHKPTKSIATAILLSASVCEQHIHWQAAAVPQTGQLAGQHSSAGTAGHEGGDSHGCLEQQTLSASLSTDPMAQHSMPFGLPAQHPCLLHAPSAAAVAQSQQCTAPLTATSHDARSASTAVAHACQHSYTVEVAISQSAPPKSCAAPSPLPGNFIVLDATDSDGDDASDDGHFAELQTQALQSEQAVATWLQQHGLSAYAAAFTQAEVDLNLVPCLTDEDLKQLGVAALGPRRKILAAAAKLELQNPEEHVNHDDSGPAACAQSAAAKAGAKVPAETRPAGKDAFTLLMQQARQERSKLCSSSDAVPEKAQAPTDALSFLMQQARGGQPTTGSTASTSGRGQRAGPGAGRAGPLRLPEWQLVPGTRFVVDKFGSKASEAAPNSKHWFLTHFHADHYGGLGPRFKHGTIYCSPITARLVHQRLKVPMGRLYVVPLHSPVQVAGVTVTFVDAHHCPGAVMILFEAPGKLPILHTGDCRCHVGMQEEECLQRVRGGVDLVLDTTYCQPQYIFPKQEEVLSFVLDAVRAEAFNEKRTLFLFGSYTIGKEKLFLEVARTLKQKMYVSMAKRKVLECIDLPADTSALLTSNDKETNLHAVPLWSVTLKSMARLLKHYRGRYTTVVGFQPSGWTQKQDRGRTGQGRRKQKGTLITYQVPYSEHSSFPEMKEFVSWLRPRRIIPSVGNDYHGPKAAHMVSLLRASVN